MRRDRLSVQVAPHVEALIEQLAAESCVRPAQMAAMLLAAAVQQHAASRGLPAGGPAIPPVQSTQHPVGSPRASTGAERQSSGESSGHPGGGPAASRGMPAPSHSQGGSSKTQENSSQRESEGDSPTCPACSGSLVTRWVERAKRNKLGCENYDRKKAKAAGLKDRCTYMREIAEVERAPNFSSQGQEARRQLYDAAAQRAQEDAEGLPHALDDPDQAERIRRAARASPLLKRGGGPQRIDVSQVVPGTAEARRA